TLDNVILKSLSTLNFTWKYLGHSIRNKCGLQDWPLQQPLYGGKDGKWYCFNHDFWKMSK
ncbi:hypothetical protein GOP47_0030558, partial [Adiantum capillus-veneris]